MSDTGDPLTLDHIRETSERLRLALPLRTIIAFLAAESLADFVLQNLIAAWVARQFPGARATAVFRSDQPGRDVVFACNPWIEGSFTADSEGGITMPLDWFDVGAEAPVPCPDPEWKKRDLAHPDLALLPGMLSVDASRLDGLAENPPLFRLPYDQAPGWASRLVAEGLERETWFACIDAGLMTGNVAPLTRHIVDVQGGKVVLLGQEIPPSLTKLDGVLALEAGAGDVEMMATAVSLARYVVAGDRLVLSLASAFGTPCAAVDTIAFENCLWNRGDVAMSKVLHFADGRRLGTRDAYEEGMLTGTLSDNAVAEDRSIEEIKAVADDAFGRTDGCQGWRKPRYPDPVVKSSGLAFPFPRRDAPLVTFWD